MHDDDDDEIRRQDYERLFGTPEERDAEAREMAERQRQIDRDEVLQWAKQRTLRNSGESSMVVTKGITSTETLGPTDELGRPLNDPAYKFDPAGIVTKDYAAPAQRAAAEAPATMTQEWQHYIERRIKRESRLAEAAHIKAAGETFIKDIVELERSNAELRERLQHLENEVADLFRMTRAQARDAEVAERLARVDELQERLARLEGGGRPLKVVG